MTHRLLGALLGGLLLVGCPGPEPDDTGDTQDTSVYEGPVITHTAPESADAAAPIDLAVVAEDSDGVTEVKAYYRTLGDPVWETLILERVSPTADDWSGTLPGSAVEAPGLQYYLRAEDGSDLKLASYLPEDGQQDPFVVDVQLVGLALPFFEDFDASTSTLSLYSLGWDEHSDDFEGVPWAVGTAQASSEPWSVGHRASSSELPDMTDYLISPPLDFGGGDEILQLLWREYGKKASVVATRTLLISTGSADPDDGDYEVVSALSEPLDGAWGDSPVVDLSEWAGEPLVYLAWRYEGVGLADWWLDDVSVGPGAPVVRFDDYVALPADPGGQTTVTIEFVNAGLAPSEAFTVTATTDAANGTFSAPVEIGALAHGVVGESAFTLDVDAAFPDDSLLPFTITADFGGGVTEQWDLDLVVGELPQATLVVTPDALGLVQGWLGVGDPDDPTVELAAFSQSISAQTTFQVDLTGYGAYLPPAPGEDRWYLRVVGNQAGDVDTFSIRYGGEDHVSVDVGPYPASEETVFYLPRPPEPHVVTASADPTPKPGEETTWTVTLQNIGAATLGETTLAVSTTDPEVTVTDVSPTVVAADGWATSTLQNVDVTLQISADKVDSRPIPLLLEVTDDVETVSTTALLDVPWPVLHVTGVVVDDFVGGDDDGTLDPGESAILRVELTNQGDLQAFAVTCTLSATGGTATADITDDFGDYGLLSIGESDDDAFGITLTAGAVGDSLDLALDCVDGAGHPFATGFQVVLGEQPWVRLSPLDDPVGDPLGGDFDLVNGRYRSDGTTYDLILESATPFEPSTVFVESWMIQQGSEYTMYQLVVQGQPDGLGGYELDGRMRGCDLYFNFRCYSFTRISTPVATLESPTEVRVAIDLDDMGLVVDTIEAGFGAGFCGGEDLFCDHLPDGWGSGVSGLATYLFLKLDVGPPGR